jgi:hypothetical protein
MSVAFGDTHAEFVRMGPGLEEVFAPTNDLRKKNGLPTVDVQDILRKSGMAIVMPLSPGAAPAGAGRGRP